MSAYNLGSNSVCATHTNCGTMTLTDKVNWTTTNPPTWTDASANVTAVDISVEYDGVVYDLTQVAGYNSGSYTVEPGDVGQSGSETFSDGIYTITVVFTDGTDTFTYTFAVLVKCALDCSIDNMTYDIATRDCQECDEETEFLGCLIAYRAALCSAFACNNFTQVENIMAWLEDLLINYNCNNC